MAEALIKKVVLYAAMIFSVSFLIMSDPKFNQYKVKAPVYSITPDHPKRSVKFFKLAHFIF